MHKPAIITLVVLPLILLSSCITSFHRLVTYGNVTTENRITGTWQQADNSIFTIEEMVKSNFFKRINKATVGTVETAMGFDSSEDSLLYTKSYLASFSRNGRLYRLTVSLVRLNNELYADFFPLTGTIINEKDTTDMYNTIDYLPSHSIAKIRFIGNSLEVKFLDGDFIISQLSKGAIAIKYETDNLFNTRMITASPAELQQFLVKYGKDERLYNAKNTITLSKI